MIKAIYAKDLTIGMKIVGDDHKTLFTIAKLTYSRSRQTVCVYWEGLDTPSLYAAVQLLRHYVSIR
jgi:hypothetical protein